ncbi:MAG: threonine/serine exporter family protein [Bacillota bacterium]|nr:threonine/serine exporter family protein [Bacillota bacterium]
MFKIILAFFISLLFGLIFQVPRNTLIACGVTGALGWIGYSLIITSQPPLLATLFSAMIIAILGEIFARIYKTPVTIFVIVGFIPLVPGLKAYNTILALTNGEVSTGIELGLQTLFTAGAIAVGISIISSVARVLKEKAR